MLSRIITGLVIIAFSAWLIISVIFDSQENGDLPIIITGIVFLVLGFIIIFNQKEDNIEEIKKAKK